MGIYHYPLQKQHTPTHSNATHKDPPYDAHKKQFTALEEEFMTLIGDVILFTAIADSPLLPPDMIQRLQTAGKHIEQLQKAAGCEGTGPWKAEDYVLALKQQRDVSLCEWLGLSGATTDAILTYEKLQVCWLETGDAVMTADGKGITCAQASDDGYCGNKQRPIADKQAFYHMELDHCKDVLEMKEFVRESGDLGEEKFLRRSVVGEWRVR